MIRRIAIALVLALLSSGCTTKAYEGPELPKSEIAVLREVHQHGVILTPSFFLVVPLTEHVTSIIEIDKKSVPGTPTAGSTIHILPGQHTARVHYIKRRPLFGPPTYDIYISINFTAKAGHEYRIPTERRGEKNWIWVEDVTSGKVVAGKKPPT